MKLKQLILWTVALVIGAIIGAFANCPGVKNFMDFVASGYTRSFQFVAVPTVALAVLTALAGLGKGDSGRIFRRTFTYTLLTSFIAALVGLILFLVINPEALDATSIAQGAQVGMVQNLSGKADTVYAHILNIIPNNFISPFLGGNVLSIILIAASVGIVLALMKEDAHAVALLN